jgi:uncharacterized protein involved in exopolysaccharide biosynthesis
MAWFFAGHLPVKIPVDRCDVRGLDGLESNKMVVVGGAHQHKVVISRMILTGLFKDKHRILLSMAAVFALAAAMAMAVTPTFTSTATLMVLLSADYSLRPPIGSEATGTVTLERDAFLKDEVEILTSPSLEKATLKKIGLDRVYPAYSKPPGWPKRLTLWIADRMRTATTALGYDSPAPRAIDSLELAAVEFAKDLTATPDKAANIIMVSFRHRDPTMAAEVVNALIKSYLAKRSELFSDIRAETVAEQADILRQKLDKASRDYANFKARNDIFDYNMQREILLRQQGETFLDLQQADRASEEAAQRSAEVQNELDKMPQDVVQYHNNTSVVRRARDTILEALELDHTRAQEDLHAKKARHDTDITQLAQIRDSIKRLEQNEFELERLDRQRNLIEQNYRTLTKELGDRNFQQNVNSNTNVRVIQEAEIPIESGRLRMVILVAGVMLSLFGGIVVAICSQVFRRGYISAEKLEASLGLPVLASVPKITNSSDLKGRLCHITE